MKDVVRVEVPPLVTFCVFTYNSAAFVEEALKSALAQVYTPLEIIVSDDCSWDDTVAIVNKIVTAYNGPHVIRVNRNSRNLGIGAHVSKVIAMARGQICVMAAGDDISLPLRTSEIVAAWECSGRRAAAVFSNVLIAEEGQQTRQLWPKGTVPVFPKTLDDVLRFMNSPVLGCSCAYVKNVVEEFEAVDPRVVQEDNAFAVRVVSLGGYEYVAAPLVCYRRHGGNTYKRHNSLLRMLAEMPSQRYVDGKVATFRTWKADLVTLGAAALGAKYGIDNAIAAAELEVALRRGGRCRALASLFLGLRTIGIKRAARLFAQYVIFRGE